MTRGGASFPHLPGDRCAETSSALRNCHSTTGSSPRYHSPYVLTHKSIGKKKSYQSGMWLHGRAPASRPEALGLVPRTTNK